MSRSNPRRTGRVVSLTYWPPPSGLVSSRAAAGLGMYAKSIIVMLSIDMNVLAADVARPRLFSKLASVIDRDTTIAVPGLLVVVLSLSV